MLHRLRQLLPKAINRRGLAAVSDTEKMPQPILEFQSPTAAVIATPVPVSARYTSWVLSAMVISILLASGFIPVQQMVTSPGMLVSSAPDVIVQNFNSSAIVKSIRVQAGQFVRKGDVLATIDPTDTTADLTALTQQAQSYSAQVAQLQAQEDGLPYTGDPSNPASALQVQTYNQQVGEYNATMQYYTQQINQLQTEINGYKAQAAYYSQRLGIASNLEAMQNQLEKLQVGTQINALDAKDNRVNIQASLASAQSSAVSTQKQLESVTAQRQGFDQQWKAQISTQLATAINNLTQTRQQLEKAQLADQLITLTAPQDAVVQSVAQVSVGSVLGAGQQLFDLTPANAPFTVQAQLDGTESGYARVGDKAEIKFQTLNFMEYGAAKGTVTSISANSINPLDTSAVQSQIQAPQTPGAPQDLYYQVNVSLDVLNLHNVPDGFRLVPGMPLEVDMVVGRQSVLRYFFLKTMPMAYQSMHEP